ncbi:hypothetical protein [Spiroplasma apis]|uniref:Uncharacterized protein n=1 Tax=Spiroplasma apis B31 TaxID=1276258 RepID=V5RIF5_SPIAP|nr:hypothetical protein [Spiroplasma apis]AHB36339.1 hypothetical protein SAPIS_v1c04940 [Spiroplasma apis B31]
MRKNFEDIVSFFKTHNFSFGFKISKKDLIYFLKTEGIYEKQKIDIVKEIIIEKNMFSTSELITEFKISKLKQELSDFTSGKSQNEEESLFKIVKPQNLFAKIENTVNKNNENTPVLEKFEYQSNKPKENEKTAGLFQTKIKRNIFNNEQKQVKTKNEKVVLISKHSNFFINFEYKDVKKVKINLDILIYLESLIDFYDFLFKKLFKVFDVINLNELLFLLKNNVYFIRDVDDLKKIKIKLSKIIEDKGYFLTKYPLYLSSQTVNDQFELEFIDYLDEFYFPNWVKVQRKYWYKKEN